MLEYFYSLDLWLFHFINNLPHTIFSDLFFIVFTLIGYGGFVWFVLGAILYIGKKINRSRFFLLAISQITVTVISELLLKNLFTRLRPEFVIPDVIVAIFKPSFSYSFPSGHAASSFAGAYVLSVFLPKYKVQFFILALLISFSRIYLGKHFPTDVLGGALVGFLVGYLSVHTFRKISK